MFSKIPCLRPISQSSSLFFFVAFATKTTATTAHPTSQQLKALALQFPLQLLRHRGPMLQAPQRVGGGRRLPLGPLGLHRGRRGGRSGRGSRGNGLGNVEKCPMNEYIERSRTHQEAFDPSIPTSVHHHTQT